MADPKIDCQPQGDSMYLMTTPSYDGSTTLTMGLAQAAEVSAGRLADDQATAIATLRYLLSHQDAVDLPDLIHFADVAAAYDDAVDAIVELVNQPSLGVPTTD